MAATAVAPSTSGTPGGDDRAERDQQDDQQQAVGDGLRLLAVLRVLSGDLLGRRGVAELLDAHLGMGGLDGGHGGERPADELLGLLIRAGELEVDDDRAAVLGGERALDVGDALDPLQASDDVPDGRGGLRMLGGDGALALHEHLLAGPVGEAGGLDDHVAALGLAAAPRRVVEVVLPDLAAEHGGEHDEQDPAEDGRLAVLGTPSTKARCGVARLHLRSPPSGSYGVRTTYFTL